jgi:hypothetical protein
MGTKNVKRTFNNLNDEAALSNFLLAANRACFLNKAPKMFSLQEMLRKCAILIGRKCFYIPGTWNVTEAPKLSPCTKSDIIVLRIIAGCIYFVDNNTSQKFY